MSILLRQPLLDINYPRCRISVNTERQASTLVFADWEKLVNGIAALILDLPKSVGAYMMEIINTVPEGQP